MYAEASCSPSAARGAPSRRPPSLARRASLWRVTNHYWCFCKMNARSTEPYAATLESIFPEVQC